MKLARTKELDAVIGQNIRNLRLKAGVTQEGLGEALGITFQQIQKYEKGANRVSAAALIHFRKALRCEMIDFFEGIDMEAPSSTAPALGDGAVKVSMLVDSMPTWKQTLVLAITKQVDRIDGDASR